MPLQNLFKNCTYYWSFGAIIGYPLCSSSYQPPSDERLVYAGLAIFLLAELGNLAIHVKLANMRPAEGSKKRDIPMGFGFDLVACPNYTFEVASWVGFSLMTGLWASWAFTALGFYQMQEWAQKKHSEYKKTYDKEYTKLGRKAIVPFVY
jgi:very-long-chain enoyl-CoA reductase